MAMRQFKVSERLTPRNSKAAQLYLSEVEKTRVMDADTEAKIARLAASGDESAKEKLVMSNLRFVLSVAKMYTSKSEDFVDLVAAGNEGLIEAAGKFDPSRGFRFISFAVWYIRKEMIKYLSENSRTIKIPTNQSQVIKATLEAAGNLSALEGRDVTNEEALEYLKETNPRFSSADSKILQKAFLADHRPASLDQEMTHERDSGTLQDVLASEDHPADELVLKENAKTSVAILLAGLSPMERKIVEAFYGLNRDSGLEDSTQQIALRIGQSPESVRVKLKKALNKMRIRSANMKKNKMEFFQ